MRSKFKDEHPFGECNHISVRYMVFNALIHCVYCLSTLSYSTVAVSSVVVVVVVLVWSVLCCTVLLLPETEKRKAEAERIRQKYSERIPVSDVTPGPRPVCPPVCLSWWLTRSFNVLARPMLPLCTHAHTQCSSLIPPSTLVCSWPWPLPLLSV